MTRMISIVHDDDNDFEEVFCLIWRVLESILGPFCGHVGALERLEGQDLKNRSIFQVRLTPFWGFWKPIASLSEGGKAI